MTVPTPQNQEQPVNDQKVSDKEFNFRQLESKYRRELEQERARREEAERIAQEARNKSAADDDDDSDPYIDHKKLEKKLSNFEKRLDEKIDKKAEEKAHHLLANQKKEMWLKQNPDFYDVLQHAEKFAKHDPELAETILEMPEGFERQKLVYKNIKALGLHKEAPPAPTMQQKLDANRKNLYYQPTGISPGPNLSGNDFSPAGQKQAYEKMQELKRNLRL